MTEAELTEEVRKNLKKLQGVKFIKISDRYTSGISDILACVNGRFVAIELKADKGKPTALQSLFIKQVRAAGGVGGVCWNWSDVENLIREAGYEF